MTLKQCFEGFFLSTIKAFIIFRAIVLYNIYFYEVLTFLKYVLGTF